MGRHSPGPWLAQGLGGVVDANGETVASAVVRGANRALIIEAPALLELVTDAYNVDDLQCHRSCREHPDHDPACLRGHAEKVLARIDGGGDHG